MQRTYLLTRLQRNRLNASIFHCEPMPDPLARCWLRSLEACLRGVVCPLSLNGMKSMLSRRCGRETNFNRARMRSGRTRTLHRKKSRICSSRWTRLVYLCCLSTCMIYCQREWRSSIGLQWTMVLECAVCRCSNPFLLVLPVQI